MTLSSHQRTTSTIQKAKSSLHPSSSSPSSSSWRIGFILLICLLGNVKSFQTVKYNSQGVRLDRGFDSSSALLAAPILERWVYLSNGSVQGYVKNHPTFDDGDEITTSTLMPNVDLVNGGTVKTRNGSAYKLGPPARGQKEVIRSKKKKAGKNEDKNVAASKAITGGGGVSFFENFFSEYKNGKEDPDSNQRGGGKRLKVNGAASNKEDEKDSDTGFFSFMSGNKDSDADVRPPSTAKAPTPAPVVRKATRQKLSLNGRTVGNGKYLLAGKAVTSSLKSLIFAGYRADDNGQPKGEQLTVKLSTNYEALERENRNYNKAATGVFPGAFVNKLEFLTYADGKGFDDYSALIIEAGRTDLRALLNERDGKGLEGRALRDAAAAAGLCIQAMHSSGLVWTDLKAENFVVVSDSLGDDDLPGVKGIDLESAMPIRSNPVDYSPEACPPEFAKAFMEGEAAEFRLDPSYDIWSLGMLLYELSTGSSYFQGQSPTLITKVLSNDSFSAELSDVPDPKLADLISKCLQKDPRKRPNITTFLLHPYFTTTGLFAWSF